MLKALTLPLLFTLFIHGLLVAIIVIDMPDSTPLVKKVTPNFVKASLVTLDKPKPKPRKTVKKPVKKKKVVDKKAAQEKEKQQKLAAQRKKEQELKKIQEQKEQERLIEEQLAKEREEQRQEELRRESEMDLADAIVAMEDAEQQAESDDELAMSYTALISTRITANWSRPPSARNNMEAELVLNLVPTGEVVSVSVVKSSGNSAFDRSAEQAVKKTAQFPELQDVPARVFEKYFRQFRLKFRPEDLRL